MGNILGRLNRPEKVTILEKIETSDMNNKLWFKVTTSSGTIGYVTARYIKTEGNAESGSMQGQTGQWSIAANNGTLVIKDSSGSIAYSDTYSGLSESIVKSIHGDYLFVAVGDNESTLSLLTLVYDTIKRKLVIKTRELDNPNVLSVSPSNRYMLIDSGTSGGVRDLTIIDLSMGKEAGTEAYCTSAKPVWISVSAFQYYITVGKKAPGNPDLPAGSSNSYAQKIIWDDGKVTKKDEYITVYTMF